MWLFTSQGMLSIVQDPTAKDVLIVRAREPGVIEHFFPLAKVVQRPERDYLYRAMVPRRTVQDVVAEYVIGIDYGNFKDSIPHNKPNYHNACHRVWQDMAAIQPTAPYSGYPVSLKRSGKK